MTVIVTEEGQSQSTAMVTITATAPRIMAMVDGAETACPVARSAGDVVNVGDRKKVQMRSPLPPLIQQDEEG